MITMKVKQKLNCKHLNCIKVNETKVREIQINIYCEVKQNEM
jgi:hypothetical protein